ncbi:zinc-binding dehydrogenase [Streptomyces prasinopilosus]|uniref:Zinc-binding dehydrogenase n=1 Tax=Streptomyces prasinopilosus TaxID=67344 RepID=A0A1G7AYV2_9ACTN|nr:zinc-binding dehydrogenase [Streptomyces prasinopilosus]SDE19999.1 Zinc-binding dehydrogenase [Streptomyces prasinopilosus]
MGLTAYQALFDHGKPAAGQRVLVNGAGGAVGGYAVQPAKNAGAHVIATAGPRSSEAVASAGADEVIDRTTTGVTAGVTEPVDVALHLAPVDPAEPAALVTPVRPGGVVVNTTVWMPAPSDEERDVRGVALFVRSDAAQPAQLVALTDRREPRVGVAERVPPAELPAPHARAARGAVHGKVVVVPSTAWHRSFHRRGRATTPGPDLGNAAAPAPTAGATAGPSGAARILPGVRRGPRRVSRSRAGPAGRPCT